MKLLSIVLLAMAILLRADPLCAATVGNPTISASMSCDNMAKNLLPEDERESTVEARLCHACTFPVAGFGSQTLLRAWAELPHTIALARQSAGHIPEPPVPPPRAPQQGQDQHFNWS